MYIIYVHFIYIYDLDTGILRYHRGLENEAEAIEQVVQNARVETANHDRR